MKTVVTLQDGMHFNGELDGHTIPMDAMEEFGGRDKGPKPKGLTLTSLAGCTAMDVISILRKMRAEPETFSVEVEAPLTDEHPKVFKYIKIIYRMSGSAVNEAKARKAISLSQDQYCGVSAMLKKACPIDYELIIEH